MLTRKYRLLVLTIASLLMILFSVGAYAWFVVINKTDSFIATAAKVDVDMDIYFGGILYEPTYHSLYDGSEVVKTGVYTINVSDMNAQEYIENLRVDIRVNSTVDTYIRVKMIDSLTLSTIDFEGNRGEVAIVDQPINYAFAKHYYVNDIYYDDLYDAEIALGGITSNDVVVPEYEWFDYYLEDGYYYYPHKLIRTNQSIQETISFIEEYDGDSFEPKSVGYHLQLIISVEAIQAENSAPELNWMLPAPPWGGSWT